MQLTVFGASGKVGREVVAIALERGYNVRAFVHNHNPFEQTQQLSIVVGDITNSKQVSQALLGSETVISTLGSWGTKDKQVVSRGTQQIVRAMEQQQIQRLVTVTGSGARWSQDSFSLIKALEHVGLQFIAGKILQDGESHLKTLEESNLAWTCVRSPVMRSGDRSNYKLNLKSPLPWGGVDRLAVATALVDLASKPTLHLRSAPHIHQA